jgi:4-amino-4-deoxy-L-arabinose transferase-like glycosyltransferase
MRFGETLPMSILRDQTESSPEKSRPPDKQAHVDLSQWLRPLFWLALALLLIAAVVMRLYHLGMPFDRDGYDEGVYWQSLRAMLAGNSLYHTIFYSQPPAFLLTVFPGFAAFGGTLWSARFSIALVSLLGFPGALLLGKSLAGRLGMFAALLLLVVNPFFLAESQIIQAEAPSVAFTFLAIGFAFLWWQRPDGWRGTLWAALAGITLVVSILCKLLCVSTLVPIALLLCARIWQIWRKQPGTQKRSWLPLLAGIACALLTALALILPFSGSFQQFWASVVTFHEAAAKTLPGTLRGNFHQMEPTLFSLLTLAAIYGTLTALLRRDWRVLPLLAWLLATFILLLIQHPLFNHHLIALEPPFIALAVLGVVEPAQYRSVLARWTVAGRENLEKFAPLVLVLAIVLILLTSAFNVWQDIHVYRAADVTSTSVSVQQDLRAANDLRQAITLNQWVITDGQFIAGLADRSTPPSLVDTSGVRIQTGYATLAQLEQAASDPRVHAVLFYTGRFSSQNVAAFHSWVVQHFHLLHTYGPGQELLVR